MGPAFWAEMPEVFAKLDADRDVRAIVLTGSGKHFSYGLDLPAMGGLAVRRARRRRRGPPARGLPRDDPAHAGRHQRRGRLPHPHYRLRARLVHRRWRGPDLGRRHPLCQRRRQVLGAGGQARDRRRRGQPGPAPADHQRRTPSRTGVDGQGHRRGAAPRRSGSSTTSTTTPRPRLRPHTRRPPRSPPTRRWSSTASRTCSISSASPGSRRACATSRRGMRRSCRRRIWPRG